MKRFAVLIIALAALVCADLRTGSANPFDSPSNAPARTGIDKLVFIKLKRARIKPAMRCSDSVFLRRVYIDVIGTLPTIEEARAFLDDKSRSKRSKLIDRLLEREEFADNWARQWGDLLRVKSEFPINLWPNAVQAYHRWIRTAISKNMPYDQFVRELLTSSGSNFRVPPVNFYRALQSNDPPSLAKAVALTFMGDRMDTWPEKRKSGMAVFFQRVGYKGTAEWKEEIVFFDITSKAAPSAILPDGKVVKLRADQDPREVFADWLITSRNQWFTRCIVNRVWYWLLGRGIIHEPDDIRPTNRPSHPRVLAFLQKELVKSKYDLKHIYRLILNSSTYQLSSIPRSKYEKSVKLFGHYLLRRLDAEVLIDALCQLTGSTEEYSSRIPEPFTWIPPEKRSISLPDGSITSSFLELFGRPPRDTGMVAERNNKPTAAQVLHMLNSSHVRNKIEKSAKMRKIRRTAWRNRRKAVNDLYLMILSRYPTVDELRVIREYAPPNRGRRGADAMSDVAWALVNSSEFLYRH